MSLASTGKIIGDGIVAALNADPDLSARAFTLRKKPYRRSKADGESFGIVAFAGSVDPPFEAQLDTKQFRFVVTVADPSDGELATNIVPHLGAIERVENIFRNKAHQHMPASIRTTAQAALDAATTAGSIPQTKIQKTTVTPASLYIDGAFEGGHDASSVQVMVECIVSRYAASTL